MIFLHIGGGAGDLDPTTNYRDGFSEFVKKYKSKNKKIFIVEANPINISTLKKSWKKFNYVKIFNFGITDKKSSKIKFYYSENDAPHYQLFSTDFNHVKRNYPNSIIKNKNIKCLNINFFLEKFFKKKKIDYFSIDIEGGDYQVLKKLNFKKFDIKNISLEYLHLNKTQKKKIIRKLINNGYSYCGFGIDHNKIDWLFEKKRCIWNIWLSKLLPVIHRKHYKRLNKLIINKKF